MPKLRVPEGVTHLSYDRDVITPVNGVVDVCEEHAQSLRRYGFTDLTQEELSAMREEQNLAGQAESNASAEAMDAPEAPNAPTNDLSAPVETQENALKDESSDNESQGKSKKGKK